MSPKSLIRLGLPSKSRILVFALLTVGIAAIIPFLARAGLQTVSTEQSLPKPKKLNLVPGEILIRFRKEAAATKTRSGVMSVVSAGRQIPLRVERLDGPEIVEGLRLARVAPEDTLAAIAGLKTHHDVVYAEPNFLRHKSNAPNDPRYPEMWNLKNTGQQGGTPGADIKAEQAWDATTGSRNVVVGVVDEGIDIAHPDLADNIWRNPGEIPGNGLDDDGNGYVDDVNGWDFLHNDNTVFDGIHGAGGYQPGAGGDQTDAHGTHVAGIIGAAGNNGVGVVGVNWQVSLMSLKFLGPNGGSTADLLRALSYAKFMRDLWNSSGGVKGADLRILNNSYGGPGFSQSELDAIRALNDAHILFVAAAGNDHEDNDRFPAYPANYSLPNVISVAASSLYDGLESLSNFGPRMVHLAAPGERILSTTPNATYDSFSGTSMAAPHVSGAATLICAQFPNVPVPRLRAALMFGGDEKVQLSATVSGRRLNAYGSLLNTAEVDVVPPAGVGNLQIGPQSGRTITLQWTAPGDDGGTGRVSAYEIKFSDGDVSGAAQFDQARSLIAPHPANAGELQTATVLIPYRHPTGFIGIRAIDNVGNMSVITQVSISLSQDLADPYIITESGANALSTGGTPLNLKGDDVYLNYDYSLPFAIKYYGQYETTVRLSTNGAIYFRPSGVPQNGEADGAVSADYLNSQRVIAGLLDDLRTDRHPGDDVYVVTPDSNHIIFRWQGVTFDGELPVNFEIEFQRDGEIRMRYGDGNTGLRPVVGISAGEPDAYLVSTHSSESSPISLTNAPTLTYSLRNPPSSDLRLIINNTPNPVLNAQELTYNIEARNFGPDQAVNVQISDVLPAETTFVSCVSNAGTCMGPAVGTNGTVSISLGAVPTYPIYFYYVAATITVRVSSPAGTTLRNTVTVTNYFRDPDPSNNSATVTADVLEDSAFTGVKAIAAGQFHTLAAKSDGTVLAWGGGYSGQLGAGSGLSATARPVQVSGLSGVIAVAAGSSHSLALKSDGTVWSWGSNDSGELGHGNYGSGNLPAQVVGLTNVTAIAAGYADSLALKADGTVWAWGTNMSGQLGNPSIGDFSRSSPVQVSGLSGVSAISLGAYHDLALKPDGTLWVWGNNQFGQLGFETPIASFAVVQVGGLTDIAAIAGGYDHSVAAKSDGTVWTWGYNSAGQLGDGTFNRRFTPAPISGISAVTGLAAGNGQVLALRTDGTVWAWGANNNGSLGVGGNGNRPTAAPLIGLTSVSAIASGATHNVALLTDGTVRTWGLNNAGQLGDGTTSMRTSPTPVSGLTIVATPTFSLAAGTYHSSQDILISCATGGAAIHYTANGQDPTENDPAFVSGGSLRIDTTTTLKVKAWKNGCLSSSINSVNYTIINQNPIDDARNFARQHYLDFLSREPDQTGWDYWTNQISSCGADQLCINARRIAVSDAFFFEPEFLATGGYVYRIYKVSLGLNPTFARFQPDRAQVVGGPNLDQAKSAFALDFVQRPVFLAPYPAAMSAQEFVDKLVLTVQQNSQVDLSSLKPSLISLYDGGSNNGRAAILRQVADNQQLIDGEYNRLFVLHEYFAYLRRDPEAAGYDFWLGQVNRFPLRDVNVQHAMVCSFITSAEYQLRFGTAVTHTNAECPQ